MNPLNPQLVAVVSSRLKGKKLENFLASVAVINDSIAQGGWVSRGRAKGDSGFYQGCGIHYDPRYEGGQDGGDDFALGMCLNYGSDPGLPAARLSRAIDRLFERIPKCPDRRFVEAWVELCGEKSVAFAHLDASRPAPARTEIGLSPRVTATLKGAGLDVDLPSVKMPEIAYRLGPKMTREGEVMMNREGTASVLDRYYYMKWAPGTKLGLSRFSDRPCNCEACGKLIPSGMFVPIEADDRKNGHIGLFVGCDCARSIFGVKDVGIQRSEIPLS
jgi:hypothetical protein